MDSMMCKVCAGEDISYVEGWYVCGSCGAMHSTRFKPVDEWQEVTALLEEVDDRITIADSASAFALMMDLTRRYPSDPRVWMISFSTIESMLGMLVSSFEDESIDVNRMVSFIAMSMDLFEVEDAVRVAKGFASVNEGELSEKAKLVRKRIAGLSKRVSNARSQLPSRFSHDHASMDTMLSCAQYLEVMFDQLRFALA